LGCLMLIRAYLPYLCATNTIDPLSGINMSI
jgi:hypothetical protein